MPPPLAPDPTYLTPGVLRARPLPSPQSDAGKERRGRVHMHGRAGDRLSAKVGRLGFLARELVAEIPTVFSELEA